MMNPIDTHSHLLEMRFRTQLAERRATLLASLGPAPEPIRFRPFARRIIALPGVIDIIPNGAGAWTDGPQAA
jgi:hypothetical protein